MKSKHLYEKYLDKEKKIAENPRNPDIPPGDFSELKGNLNGVYHIRLNQKHRIFYTISDKEKSIFIDKIEENDVDGYVRILQTFGHDLR